MEKNNNAFLIFKSPRYLPLSFESIGLSDQEKVENKFYRYWPWRRIGFPIGTTLASFVFLKIAPIRPT